MSSKTQTHNFKRQWADGPLPLIESPLATVPEGEKESPSSQVATEMSHVHNCMIRALNALLVQAPYITKPQDQADFARFANAFCITVAEHHQTEETLFFPLVEQAAGEVGIMDKNVVQHEAFHPGFHAFNTYTKQVINGVAPFDAKKITQIIESFGPILTEHLRDEVALLATLDKYNINWEPLLKRAKDHAIETAEKYHQLPFILTNMDITYENGLHKEKWPPIPWFAQLMFRWMYVPKHKGAWRFSSCDSHGVPQELPFAPLKDAAKLSAAASSRNGSS